MSKGKIYQKNGRTFEVNVYNDFYGVLISIYIDEIKHPERKFFKKKEHFYLDHVNLQNFLSIEEAVELSFSKAFENERENNIILDKWEEWNK